MMASTTCSGVMSSEVQCSGIQNHRILRLPERVGLAVHVLLVARVQFAEHLLIRGHVALLHLLLVAAACALLRRGRQKDFHGCIRQHARADVPSVDQHVRRRGDLALRGHHAAANRRPLGNAARRGGNLASANQIGHILLAQHRPLSTVAIGHAHIRLAAARGNRLLILRINPVSQHIQRDRAIHRARIQMQNMKSLRYLIGNRRLARAHRAVNGNVHRHISFSSRMAALTAAIQYIILYRVSFVQAFVSIWA